MEFLHETRSLGLTDHSAFRVRFEGDAERIAVAVPTAEPTLF
ncbi:hypothetical protein O1R50_08930 [Glycomyces luteolus]|uniref:Uncharacterized protein n=1 Tax=Glycomyces luteolus TaxID=2670330 RepID=A0A9X3SRB0_9ACTN|nr:hypothetical protein [Glycomyces luteolus]MDA1359744.1 hypothetical protein [Glycomyces luteolus]